MSLFKVCFKEAATEGENENRKKSIIGLVGAVSRCDPAREEKKRSRNKSKSKTKE